MKVFLVWIGRKAANGIVTGVFIILTVASVAYALNYNWTDPTSIRNRTVGNPLTSTGWNILVGNVDNLNERVTNAEGSGGIVPAWAVMTFNLVTCPSGWSSADGTGGRPDLRGEFVRGLDSGRGVDAGRVRGSWQVATSVTTYVHGDQAGGGGAVHIALGDTDGTAPSSGYYSYNQASPVAVGNLTYDSRFYIRPRNIALLYCIKN